MKRAKLTKQLIDRLSHVGTETILWDDALKGFGLRCYPSGRQVFFIQYRPRGSRSARRVTIGPYGPVTAEAARAKAKRLLGEVATGGDPSAERAVQSQEPTLNALLDRFLNDHVRRRLRSRTVYEYERAFDRYVRPKLGSRKLSELTPKLIGALKRDLEASPTMANRMLRYLSSALSYAEREEIGLAPPGWNPAKSVRLNPEKRRIRSFRDEELIAIFKGLAAVEREGANPGVLLALRLSLLLGWRISECAALRWADVDLAAGTAILRDAKAGTRTTRLSKAAVDLLRDASRLGVVVAPGRDPDRPIDYASIRKVWRRACDLAKVEDAQIHDCRRSMATRLANANASAAVLQAVLGHATPSMALRYVADARAGAALAIDDYGEAMVLLSRGVSKSET